MEYIYAPNRNYEDFACGRVIYHMGGAPGFPVRLAVELYERCLKYSDKKRDIILYDCCCGGAYMLTVLGLLKGESISRIYASDLDRSCIGLAADNLELLTEEGLNKRGAELAKLYESYGKESHKEALESLDRIKKLITNKISTEVFVKNALEAVELSFLPDIIITDVPYGNMTAWNEGNGGVNKLMDALYDSCGQDTVIGICMDKKQKIMTERYHRFEKQQIGKRKFEIYKKK